MNMQNIDAIHDENAYGYPFVGDVVLLIWMDSSETNLYQKNVRGGKEYYVFLLLENTDPSFKVVDHVYFFTDETIYKTQVKDFHWSANGCYFNLYGMKERYYSMDSLQDYEVIKYEKDTPIPYCLIQKR